MRLVTGVTEELVNLSGDGKAALSSWKQLSPPRTSGTRKERALPEPRDLPKTRIVAGHLEGTQDPKRVTASNAPASHQQPGQKPLTHSLWCQPPCDSEEARDLDVNRLSLFAFACSLTMYLC